MNRKAYTAIVGGLLTLGTLGFITTADAAPAPVAPAAAPAVSTSGPGVYRGTMNWCIKAADVRPDTKASDAACPAGFTKVVQSMTGATGPKGATGATGPQGTVGPKGDKGDSGTNGSNGSDGEDAILTVSASTSVSDRNDSGVAGNWAKDTFGRTVTISRNSAVDAAKCGASAVKCWFYTGKIADLGTFETIAGAKTPNDGSKTIEGVLTGNFSGGSEIEFFSSDGTPDASGVVPTTAGNAIATSDWYKQFFGASATYGANDALLNWGWTYGPTSTCESWINSKAANVGNITGVNACSGS